MESKGTNYGWLKLRTKEKKKNSTAVKAWIKKKKENQKKEGDRKTHVHRGLESDAKRPNRKYAKVESFVECMGKMIFRNNIDLSDPTENTRR